MKKWWPLAILVTLTSCAGAIEQARRSDVGVTCIQVETATLFSMFSASGTVRQIQIRGNDMITVEEAESLIDACFQTTTGAMIQALQERSASTP